MPCVCAAQPSTRREVRADRRYGVCRLAGETASSSRPHWLFGGSSVHQGHCHGRRHARREAFLSAAKVAGPTLVADLKGVPAGLVRSRCTSEPPVVHNCRSPILVRARRKLRFRFPPHCGLTAGQLEPHRNVPTCRPTASTIPPLETIRCPSAEVPSTPTRCPPSRRAAPGAGRTAGWRRIRGGSDTFAGDAVGHRQRHAVELGEGNEDLDLPAAEQQFVQRRDQALCLRACRSAAASR